MQKYLNFIADSTDCFCNAPINSLRESYLDCGVNFNAEHMVLEGSLGCAVGQDLVIDACVAWRQSFPELQITNIPVVTQPNIIVTQWKGSGVQAGELMGISATNREVQFSGTSIYTFSDGKLVNYKNIFDMLAVMKQICLPQDMPKLPDLTSKYTALETILKTCCKGLPLSNREVAVLSFWIHGRSAKEIGNFFTLSYRTVQAYIANIMGKLDCNSKRALFEVVHYNNALHLFREFYDLCIMSKQ